MRIALLALGAFLTMLACMPAAAPGIEDNADGASAPTDVSMGGDSGKATVIAVNKEVESEGITIGVTDVELTSEQAIVSYWMDCGTHEVLEPVGQHKLIVDGGLELQHVGGGDGKVCDPSDIKQLEFEPVPAGSSSVTLQYGPSVGTTEEELVLELPIGSHLSEMDRFGGEIDLDMTVQSDGLAYRFTRLGYGIDRFSLEYEPANEAARWRPLSGPMAEMTIEDDLGNEFPGRTGNSRFDGNLALKTSRLEFSEAIAPSASVWKLRILNPGKIYRGPWEIDIPIPSGAALASNSPTATPEPMPTAAPRPTFPPRPTPVPGIGPSRLEEALAMAPLEFAERPVMFSDYDGSRVATDLEELRGPDVLLTEIEHGDLRRLYEGLPPLNPLRLYQNMLIEQLGLNIMGMDMGIWSLEPPGSGPKFMALQGLFDSHEIAEKALKIEYKRDEHSGTAFYRLHDDFRATIRHPLRQLGLPLNRIATIDDRFLAAPSTAMMETLIDAQNSDPASLMGSEPHKAIAGAVGDGLLGAGFTTPERIVERIVENWNIANAGLAPRLERYAEGPDRWGKLSPYSLALLGYRVRGGAEEIVTALYYPDADAAAKDADELERRWNSFYYYPSGYREQEVPATDSCSPLSTEVVAGPDYSILLGACQVIRGEERDLNVKGPYLWTWLFGTGELHFLVPDLAALKAASPGESQ